MKEYDYRFSAFVKSHWIAGVGREDAFTMYWNDLSFSSEHMEGLLADVEYLWKHTSPDRSFKETFFEYLKAQGFNTNDLMIVYHR